MKSDGARLEAQPEADPSTASPCIIDKVIQVTEELYVLQTTAAAWVDTIKDKKYTRLLRRGIDNLLISVVTAHTRNQHILEDHRTTAENIVEIDSELKSLQKRWGELKVLVDMVGSQTQSVSQNVSRSLAEQRVANAQCCQLCSGHADVPPNRTNTDDGAESEANAKRQRT